MKGHDLSASDRDIAIGARQVTAVMQAPDVSTETSSAAGWSRAPALIPAQDKKRTRPG